MHMHEYTWIDIYDLVPRLTQKLKNKTLFKNK